MPNVLIFIGFAFIGYLIGRFGHYYLNPKLNYPMAWHHWIYGVVLMGIGIFYEGFFAVLLFFFGAGHFISDFKDFLQFKIFKPDEKGKKKFWGTD